MTDNNLSKEIKAVKPYLLQLLVSMFFIFVHILDKYNTCIDTSISKAHLLHPSCSSNAAAASASLHDVDVTSLIRSRDEPYAGLLVVLLHCLGDDAPLAGAESSGDDVGNNTIWPLSPAISDCISSRLTLYGLLNGFQINICNVTLNES